MSETPFTPTAGATVNIDVSGSSQSVAITMTGATQIRLYNDGSATVWVDFSAAALSATLTTSMPVPAGGCEVLSFADSSGTINAAAIAAGATGKIYFTPGKGI